MEEGHVYFIAYEECDAAGYVSIQQQDENLFHLHKIYVHLLSKAHCGSFLFRGDYEIYKRYSSNFMFDGA